MADSENVILAELRELPAELKTMKGAFESRLGAIEKHVEAMQIDNARPPRGLIGLRALTERTVMSIDDQINDLLRRMERVEATCEEIASS